MNSQDEAHWKTIPNLLTLVRIFFVPAFVVAFLQNQLVLALWLFVIAGVTDGLDGFLARILRQRSVLGTVIDPLADKILLDAGFICLGIAHWIPVWLAVLVVSRDAIIVGGLAFLHFWGVDVRNRISPSWTSKVNTSLQIILVGLVLILKVFEIHIPEYLTFLFLLVAALTIVSGIQYVLWGTRYLAEQEG